MSHRHPVLDQKSVFSAEFSPRPGCSEPDSCPHRATEDVMGILSSDLSKEPPTLPGRCATSPNSVFESAAFAATVATKSGFHTFCEDSTTVLGSPVVGLTPPRGVKNVGNIENSDFSHVPPKLPNGPQICCIASRNQFSLAKRILWRRRTLL